MAAGDRDDYHPSPEELEHFLLGEMSSRQAAPVLAHLMHGCTRCQTTMEPRVSVMFGGGRSAPEPSLQGGSEYDFPLFKALASARQYAATRAKTGDRLTSPAPSLKGLAALKSVERETPDPQANERDWARCRRLIERCQSLRYSDPETMVLTATLAVVLTGRLSPGSFGLPALADLQAYALAERGNSQRIAENFVDAEADLAAAMERAGQGTSSPRLLAHLMDLTASLYTDQRRYDEALRLRDAVYAIHVKEGDRHLAGRALISKGFSLINALKAEEGIPFLTQGLGMIDAARDPKLVMSGVFNLIWSLAECGQAVQAEPLLNLSRGLFSAYIERMDAIKCVWLEGRLAAALGEDADAERLYCDALTSYEEIGLPGYVALVSIDLASLWLRSNRTAEIAPLIEQTIATFRTFGFDRDVIGMLLVVHRAIKKSQVTESLLRTTGAELLRYLGHKDRVLG